MNDEDSRHTGPSRDLRTVTGRLVDLQRKCRSVGSKNQEAAEMEDRLGSVLQRLQPADDDDAAVPYAALARELYAVERFFESSGFITVAKEVAHVERALEAMADESEAVPSTPIRPPGPAPAPEPAHDGVEDAAGSAEETETPRWAVPRPLAAVLALFVIALGACAAVIWIVTRDEPAAARATTTDAEPTPTRSAPTPTPIADPGSRQGRPAPGAILAESVGKARLALANGDLEEAMDELSRAALVDADHRTVLETAGHIVNELVDRANAAADGGLWEIAELTLARAERIANRFGLDTTRIREARFRHSQMDRFRLVDPADTDAIRAAVGSRVTIHFKRGSSRESVIQGVSGGELLLDEDTEVRGGAMYYTEHIPLAEIDHLKVWEE